MRIEKSYYCGQQIGPGGRHCSCCAPISKELKKLEHRKARRLEKKQIECEIILDKFDESV